VLCNFEDGGEVPGVVGEKCCIDLSCSDYRRVAIVPSELVERE